MALARAAAAALLLLGASGRAWGDGAPLPVPESVESDPEAEGFAELLFARGMLHLADAEYASALERFRQASRAVPADGTYRYFAGVCSSRLGRFESAIRDLSSALPPAACRVPATRVRHDLALARYRAGDPRGAAGELRKGGDPQERDPLSVYLLGLALYAAGEERKGLERMESAASSEAALLAGGGHDRGFKAAGRGDRGAAIRGFEDALESAERSRGPAGPSGAAAPRSRGGRSPLFEGRVAASAEYDNRPEVLDRDFALAVSAGAGDEVRGGWRGVLDLRVGVHPLNGQGGFTFGVVVNGMVSRNGRVRDADFQAVQPVLQATFGSDPRGFVAGPLGYARVPVGTSVAAAVVQAATSHVRAGYRGFRREDSIGAAVIVREGKVGAIQLEGRYDDLRFYGEPPDGSGALPPQAWNGHSVSAAVSQWFNLGGPSRWLRLAVTGASFDARLRETIYDPRVSGSRVADPLDRMRWEIRGELVVPFAKRVAVLAHASRARETYDDLSGAYFYTPDAEPREDTLIEASASLVVEVERRVHLWVRYAWDRHTAEPTDGSWQEGFGLDGVLYRQRSVAGAGVSWTW